MDQFRHDQININNNLIVISMSEVSKEGQTGLISVKSKSKLRKLHILLPNWLKLDNCVIQGIVSKDQGAIFGQIG